MTSTGAITSLRRFVSPREASLPRERCDLCSSPIGSAHRHLFDPKERRLACACDACALLFPGTETLKYLPVPRRVTKLSAFTIDDAEWDGMGVPIGLAFFSRRPVDGGIVAVYPSPAGSTESVIASDAWSEFAGRSDALVSMEDEVEALLVNRTRGNQAYFIAPIDRCFELTGLIRLHWRGLSGGSEVWEAIDQFFGRLAAESHA